MKRNIELLKNIINFSNSFTFFIVACIFDETGIPDFRSIGGLYEEISKKGYSPEYLLSEAYFQNDPESFINFCHDYLLFADKKPNIVHQWIAQLEQHQQSLG